MLRTHLLVISCVASATLVALLLLSALDAASIARPPVALDLVPYYERTLKRLASPRSSAMERRLAFLGDSTAVSYPLQNRVSPQLAAALERQGRNGIRYRVYSFAFPALAAHEYYFLSPAIRSGNPDGVVIAFNLASLSKRWKRLFKRPELAGQLPWARLDDAVGLPLDWIGVSLDRLLIQMSAVHLGLGEPWRLLQQEHARVGRGWETLGRWLDGAPPVEERPLQNWWNLPAPGSRDYRQDERRARDAFGAALRGAESDHPVLRMLGAAVGIFEESEIPALVYAVPVNLEHLERLGLLRREGLARTLAAARAQVEAHGGRFVDLHDLFPDSMFRDAGNHLYFEEPRDGPARLAEELAPRVARLLQRRDSQAP